MLKFLRRLLRINSYHALNTVEITASSIIDNYTYLSHLTPSIAIAPVLKSNAYGHTLSVIGKIVDNLSVPFICVDSLFEAYELQKNKIHHPILIMGHTSAENISYKRLPFSYVVYDSDFLHAIATHQPHAGIHIFIDTGMHREGVPLNALPAFIDNIKQYPSIKIDGVMTHLAAADNIKNKDTLKQLTVFQKAVAILGNHGITPRFIHGGASSALLRHKIYGEYLGNCARVGSALYGIDPARIDRNLKPALCLASKIGQIKQLKKGEKIGYDFTYTAKKDMTIATLPIGYHDGVERELSNKGVVLIDSIPCPIIGLISMNITTIDISAVPNPQVGQRVIIYSNNPTDPNCLQNVSKLTGKSGYELMIHITPFTKRIVL